MRLIKLMADYECYPLWEASPGNIGNIDPTSLPISELLANKLMNWAGVYDKTLNYEDPINSGFLNTNELLDFELNGLKLAEKMLEELGPEFSIICLINSSLKSE